MNKPKNWIIEVKALVDNRHAVSESQAIQLTREKLKRGEIDLKLSLWDVHSIKPKSKNLDHLSDKFKF